MDPLIPTMIYGTIYWAIKKQHVHKMSIAKIRMLRWINGNKRKNRIRNEGIHLKIEVTPIDEKMRKSRLRWFVHVQRRPINAPVTKTNLNNLIQVEGMKEAEEDLK